MAIAIKARLRTYGLPLLGGLYYRFLFGRRSMLTARLGRVVATWERDRGDVPIDPEAWEAAYRAGRWDFLQELGELPRYSIIGGYVRYLRSGGTILDVGCGPGILALWLKGHYRSYLGVDVSSTAVVRARMNVGDAKTKFRRVDAEVPIADGPFDVIVFNECLYYFRDPLGAFQRYVEKLAPGGLVIVSMYRRSYRAVSILRRLQKRYVVLDTTRTAHGRHAWECSVLSGARAARSR